MKTTGTFMYEESRPDSLFGVKAGSVFVESLDNMSDDFWTHVPSNEERTVRKFELVMAMGIKSVLHFCFNPEFLSDRLPSNFRVRIRNIFSDGVRGAVNLSRRRLLNRLGNNNLRNYVEMPDSVNLEFVPKSNTKTEEVNLQELTDVVLGTTRYLSYESHNEVIAEFVRPLRDVYEKLERGKDFRNSTHFRTFTLSTMNLNKSGEIESWDSPTLHDNRLQSATSGLFN